jgi:beta-glucosidase
LTELARRFPPGFLWGTATAAYQIEGGWDADGKGESIWDTFCRVPGAIETGETGETACDHYRLWEQDVDLMTELGLNAYRFSVSWPRVVPAGTGPTNVRGLDFYDRLVDALLARGIRPFVTLYHWDLPQVLQDRGGWGTREVVGWFAEYATAVAHRLGDRVHDWITINEPEVVAFAGHAHGVHAPGHRDWRLALRVAHHLLLAHAQGAAAIRGSARDPSVGIAVNLSPCEPARDDPADVAAAHRLDGHLNRWFLDPLFARGYPPDVVEWYGDLLDAEAPAAIAALEGRLDFLGINYYSRQLARADGDDPLRLERVTPPEAQLTSMGWEVYPDGLRSLLERVHRDYRPARIYVTENGAAFDDASDADGRVDDTERRDYLAAHLDAAARAVDAGVPLDGYFVWSLLDNFEWAHGTSKRFGLIRVDYDTLRRTVKASGAWYRELAGAAKASPAR